MINTTRTNNINGHGSATDRGSADRYYGRPYHPHYYVGATSFTPMVDTNLTPEEIAAYKSGWDNEDDRKEWN